MKKRAVRMKRGKKIDDYIQKKVPDHENLEFIGKLTFSAVKRSQDGKASHGIYEADTEFLEDMEDKLEEEE